MACSRSKKPRAKEAKKEPGVFRKNQRQSRRALKIMRELTDGQKRASLLGLLLT